MEEYTPGCPERDRVGLDGLRALVARAREEDEVFRAGLVSGVDYSSWGGGRSHREELLDLLGELPTRGVGVLRVLRGVVEVDPCPEVILTGLMVTQAFVNQAQGVAAALAGVLYDVLPVLVDEHGKLNTAATEIAAALRVGRVQADQLIRVGRATRWALPATGQALGAGSIDLARAWAVVDCLTGVDLHTGLTVEEAAVPDAPYLSVTQLRQLLARLVTETDPDAAGRLHERARGTRTVTRPCPLPNGMARLMVRLPAEDAHALDTALEATAVEARNRGDARSYAQLRADTLARVAHEGLRAGLSLTLDDGKVIHSPPATLNLTVPLELIANTLPAWVAPPTPADLTKADLNGVYPDTTSEVVGVGGMPITPTRGHRIECAWLEGYGPLPPKVAILMAAGGTWRRVVTDPLSGRPLDVARTRYRAPTHLRYLIRLRDSTCVYPGCATPASRTENDHVWDWAKGGPTSEGNFACLCAYHHRVKTLGGGSPTPIKPDGTRDWVSITGRTYKNLPKRAPRHHGTTHIISPPGCPNRAGPGSSQNQDPYDDPPPF